MSQTRAPEVLWAQRSSEYDAAKNTLLITIHAPNLQEGYEFTLPAANKLHFKGTSKPSAGEERHYACDIDLFGEVDQEEVKHRIIGKGLSVVLQKKELQEDYWPRLSRDKRVNNIKTDFDRWVDQDEQDGAPDDDAAGAGAGAGAPGGMDMASLMAGMGGGGGMGMPGMGMGGGPGGDMDMEALMKQFGGGAGGAGLGGAGASGDVPEEDSDDDMPPLEAS